MQSSSLLHWLEVQLSRCRLSEAPPPPPHTHNTHPLHLSQNFADVKITYVLQVKFNVNRVDNMIIQAIALLDTLDKDINTFVMRVREWYSWHFPELVKLAADNYQ